jgi:hypothetical protein
MHFDSAVGSVDWDERTGAVLLTWKMFADGEEFRAVTNAGVELGPRRARLRHSIARGSRSASEAS